MSLYRAETRRLLNRRFTRYLTLAGLLVLLVVAVGVFLSNQKTTPAVVAAAQVQADAQYRAGVESAEQTRAACVAAKGTPSAATDFPDGCDAITATPRDQFDPQWFLPPTFDFREGFERMATALAGILALVAFVVGASFVGAEWHSGGMMNLLLWRPQRIRVLATKLAALLVGFTVLTVLASVFWTGLMWVIATLRGSTKTMTSGVWQSFALTEVRGLVLVLAAATIGFGLASLGRHTAMAFGVAIGVVVLLQLGLGTVLKLANVPFVEAYLIPVWGAVWMQKSMELQDYTSCNVASYSGNCEPNTLMLTWPVAGGMLATAVVLIVVAAMWTIRSRDIT